MCLPFGINSAQEMFHKRKSQIFEDTERFVTYIDYEIISAKTRTNNNRRLRQVLRRARKINLRSNKGKSKMDICEVKYFSHILSQD